MAALTPPPNSVGISLPPTSANPTSLVDITNAKEYVERLSAHKIAVQPQPHAAIDADIGAAEAYKTALVFSLTPGADVAPPWLMNMNATIQQLAANVQQLSADVAHLRQRSDEQPILFANNIAGRRGTLFNPTTMRNGWALLGAPNPRTQDELNYHFTAEQCIASANDLGLPVLPEDTDLLERRRQIGARIGVTI
ncbi:hypothetical protein B0H34DRAFT_672501 [Crassisporium funariophilum]|nr:hypothetical protein B0H34DRAFT_672501 [Crassisporium funariophilum]